MIRNIINIPERRPDVIFLKTGSIRTFLILFCIITFHNTYAQETPPQNKRQHSLQLISGIQQIKEKNLHPKVHQGMSTGLGYQSSREIKNVSQFEASILFTKLKTDFENNAASINIQLNLNKNYLFKIRHSQKLRFHTGIEGALQYRISHYPNWDESHLYWANYASINSASLLSFNLKEKQVLTFSLNIPVIMLLSRPESNRQFKIDDLSLGGLLESFHSTPELSGWNRNFVMRFAAEYTPNWNLKLRPSVAYKYQYESLKNIKGNAFINNGHHLAIRIIL